MKKRPREDHNAGGNGSLSYDSFVLYTGQNHLLLIAYV